MDDVSLGIMASRSAFHSGWKCINCSSFGISFEVRSAIDAIGSSIATVHAEAQVEPYTIRWYEEATAGAP